MEHYKIWTQKNKLQETAIYKGEEIYFYRALILLYCLKVLSQFPFSNAVSFFAIAIAVLCNVIVYRYLLYFNYYLYSVNYCSLFQCMTSSFTRTRCTWRGRTRG